MATVPRSPTASPASPLSDARRNALAERHYARAIKYAYMAKQEMAYTLDHEALVNAAHDGLVKTLRCWRSDGDRGFRSYLFQSVRGKVIDTVRAAVSRRKCRPPTRDLGDVASHDGSLIDWASDATGVVDVLDEIAACEPRMNTSEWRCLLAHLELGMDFGRPRATDIGAAVGLGKAHASRSIGVALGIVRARLDAASRDQQRPIPRPSQPAPPGQTEGDEVPRVPREQRPRPQPKRPDDGRQPPAIPDHGIRRD